MKQVFLNGKGGVEVLDAPVPGFLRRSVLIRTDYSLISQGTEGAAVAARQGWMGLYEKALHSRDRSQQVLDLVQKEGVAAASRLIMSKLEDLTPIGYSSSGVVEGVSGPDVPFRPGDRVACMGTGFASHAAYAVVPAQLVATIPPEVTAEHAAFGAVACIAMQGIRRLELTPGETVCIIGLGLIGQLTVQLAVALGFRALGIDVVPEKARVAIETGAVDAWTSETAINAERVGRWTDGHGADGVVICAGVKSDEPLNLALDLCRQRGRVSIVGDVGLDAERSKMYSKELEIRMSCSYGPGRYDTNYELDGNDYPLAHARWTEGRNLSAYLDLLARQRLHVERLVSRIYPVADAVEAYRSVKVEKSLFGVLFKYNEAETAPERAKSDVVRFHTSAALHRDGPIRLGVIGCGGFTKAIHLPNLKKLSDRFRIDAVASRSGSTAAAVAKRTAAAMATSDYKRILDDPDIDAVLVATRHSSHGSIILEALEAGKHVFVEKPLAITSDECRRIVELESATGLVVRVGFNRRFAPLYRSAKKAISGSNQAMISYRVGVANADKHWSNVESEGGRLLGEGCHFFDLFNWFYDERPLSIVALSAGESRITNPNLSVCVQYPSGSTATLIYSALGSAEMPKERLEAFCGGVSLECVDFQSLTVYGGNGSTKSGRRDKGHASELEEFAAAVRDSTYSETGASALAGALSTEMALAAITSAQRGSAVELTAERIGF